MKFYVFSVIISIVITSVYSCKKDADMSINDLSINGNVQYSLSESEYIEFVAEDINEVEDLLMDFKDEIDAEVVSDKDIGIGIWTIVTYSNGNNFEMPEYGFDSIYEDSIIIYVDSVGESISGEAIIDGDDVLTGYNSLNSHIQNMASSLLIMGSYIVDVDNIGGEYKVTIGNIMSTVDAGIILSSTTDYEYTGISRKAVTGTCIGTPQLEMPEYLKNNLTNGIYPLYRFGEAWTCGGKIVFSNYYEIRPFLDPNDHLDYVDYLYCNYYDNCVTAGSINDVITDNTINGYYDGAMNMMFDQEDSYTQTNRYVTSVIYFNGHWRSGLPNMNCRASNAIAWRSAQLWCVDPDIFD